MCIFNPGSCIQLLHLSLAALRHATLNMAQAEFTFLSFPTSLPRELHLSTLQRPETGATLDFSFIAFAAPLTALGLPSQALCIALCTVASSHLYVLVLDSFLPSPHPAPAHLTPQLCCNLQGVWDSFSLFTVGNWPLVHYLSVYIC